MKNEGSASQNAKITVDLISNTGETRDIKSQVVSLQPNESKKVRLVLDGEDGVEYSYKYHIEQL